jgi:uncharacterized protein (UPF0261 family)
VAVAKRIVIVGTLDTKESEGHYIRDQIEKLGHEPILLDVSLRSYEPQMGKPDISNEEVSRAAGVTMDAIDAEGRAPALEAMVKGASKLVAELYETGRLDGIIGYGGGCGLTISSLVLGSLPLGIPKIIVTTMPAEAGRFIGSSDIGVLGSVTDMAGSVPLNRIEAIALANAAGAICGMVEAKPVFSSGRLPVGASQFGVTTTHIKKAEEFLGKRYELIAFHATGNGGRTLEELARSGMVVGVLDATTHELADELVGGVLSAGPNRLEAAGVMGIPQVILPGALDMVNFFAPNTIPEKFKDRRFYHHAPTVTLMRTSKEECGALGRIVAEKANRARGPTAIILPLNGWSDYDKAGGVTTVDYYGNETHDPWHDLEADDEFVANLEESIDRSKPNLEVIKRDFHINDADCARLATAILDRMIRKAWEKGAPL